MITTLTASNAQSVIDGSQNPVVIDVFATWCGPCMHMKPIFEKVAQEHADTYTFAQLNVDEARELAIQYGITSVPTFLFLKNGKIVGKETGAMSKEDLVARLQEYFA